MKTKVLDIKQVLLDKEAYPRSNPDWITISRYANAMSSGATFPPITVGFLDGKYYLIDGKHRIEASKILKQQHISAEVLGVKDKKEIYLEAVKRNIAHGKQFYTQEVTNIIITLGNFGLDNDIISGIVRIPADKLSAFVAKRAVYILDNKGKTEQTALRKTFQHLAGTTQTPDYVNHQDNVIASGQIHLVNSVISLIENNWLDENDPQLINRIEQLSKVLQNFLSARPTKKKSIKPKKKKVK